MLKSPCFLSFSIVEKLRKQLTEKEWIIEPTDQMWIQSHASVLFAYGIQEKIEECDGNFLVHEAFFQGKEKKIKLKTVFHSQKEAKQYLQDLKEKVGIFSMHHLPVKEGKLTAFELITKMMDMLIIEEPHVIFNYETNEIIDQKSGSKLTVCIEQNGDYYLTASITHFSELTEKKEWMCQTKAFHEKILKILAKHRLKLIF